MNKPISSAQLVSDEEPSNSLLLSGPGGSFPVDEETRQLLAYYSDGKLLISKSHEFDLKVESVIGRLKRLDKPFLPQYVELSMIAAAYNAQNGKASAAEHSSMQDLAKKLFNLASHKRASDIHIRVDIKGTTQILMRENGLLELVDEQPGEVGKALCSAIYQGMADIADATYDMNSPQDGRINARHKLPPSVVAIRISTAPTTDGTSMVLRMLYNDTSKSTELLSLGFHKSQVKTTKRLKAKPYGLNIISGPTGSGKSTTLQKILIGIIKEVAGKLHVITVEDPPEYPVKGATMIPVANAPDEASRAKAFHAAIRTALRQDPDVLMIGEIRDAPAATLSFECAMTGHPTYATLHANSPLDIIERLINIGVSPNLVHDFTVVTGLSSQRLVAVLCDGCKTPLSLVKEHYHPDDVDRIVGAFGGGDHIFTKNPKGCEKCGNTGLVDRTVIAEIIETTPELMNILVHQGKVAAHAHFIGNGGLSIASHAHMKVAAGNVDPFAAEHEVGYLHASHGEFALNYLD